MKKLFIFTFFIFLLGFCPAQSIFFEGFEGTGFPPPGWNIIDVSGTKTWFRSTDYQHSGNASAEHGWLAGSVQATALVTPPIQIPTYGNPELDFWSRIQLVGYNNSSKILISTTVNNDINAFTLVKVLAGDEVTIAAWRNIIIPLNAYLGQTIYIAFLYTADNGPRWFIDDIKVNHFASFTDIQPVGITPISGDYPLFSSNETITVRVKNNGGTPASGFNLKLFDNGNLKATELFPSSIPSLGEVTYTFNTKLDLSTAGMHKVKVVTNLPGDQVPANDTATSMINNLGCSVINSFPYFEGFENNGNNLPPCWTQEFVAENYSWRVYNAAGAQSIGIEPIEAFEGSYRAFFYTNGKDGAIVKLIAPPMDISTLENPVLKFHHVQRFYAGDQDSLKVYFKTGAHEPWVLLVKFTETITNWTERIIPLPEPSSQYYIAFEAYAEWGYPVQIDAVTIDDYVGKDIAVKDINPKGTHLGLSSQEQVTVTLKNNGRDPITGFNLILYCNESLISTETYTNSIPGLGEANYIFNTKVDLSVSGYYKLTVVAELEGDEVPENNELTVIVRNLVCDALTFPYDEGFEEELFPPHCWTKVGEWKRVPYSAHTGIGRASYAWWDGSLGWLISPKFSIPEVGDFMLEFWSHIYEKKFFTYSGVWISTTNNNPSSFTEILSLSGDLIPDEIWKRIEVPLSNYAGKDIYIAFKYTNSGGQSGHCWSIDDINIFNLSNFIDAEVADITAPPSLGMNLSSTEPVTVKIKNNGGSNINGFKLLLECNGIVVANESYTGYIPSLVTANYTFNKKVNLSAAGLYTLKVTVILENDMNPNNDSKTKTVENRVCPPVTNFPWHGEFQGNAAGEIADCWINIDADGDTKKWFSLESNGCYYALSESYDAVYEFPLTPDNWLISPPLTINNVCTLSYKVGSANSEQLGKEKYSVLISKTGIALSDFSSVRTETLYPSDFTELLTGTLLGYGVKTVRVPLASYSGETIHIAFRHWDCTEQDKLILTDIIVFQELAIPEVNGNTKPLVAWSYNDLIYVGGLNIGDSLDVYSVTGQLVYHCIARSETEHVKLTARGVYIVKSGYRAVKAVY